MELVMSEMLRQYDWVLARRGRLRKTREAKLMLMPHQSKRKETRFLTGPLG